MDTNDVLGATEAERLALADLLAGLDQDEWATRSLCPAWTVRDVAAHLTLVTRTSLLSGLVGLVRARGDLDRLIKDAALSTSAAVEPNELVQQMRDDAGSAKRPPGTRVQDPFVDVLVHAQDITRPLGHSYSMPLDRAEAGLAYAWTSTAYAGVKRFAGLRLVATDVGWTGGDGSEVRGRAEDLLLLVTGRASGLARLDGPGRDDAQRRIST